MTSLSTNENKRRLPFMCDRIIVDDLYVSRLNLQPDTNPLLTTMKALEPTLPVRRLYNKDFKDGTVRLTQAGKYVLMEDIVFNPRPDNDWKPPVDSKEHPFIKYKLGFFAALTIEGNDIILDGQGFTIQQSRAHYLQQRFFACIETADQPFIPKQGPDPLAPSINAGQHVWIRNVALGLSSHHGIHGNNNTHLLIENVTISNFEIAGISLNGGVDVYLKDLTITHSARNVPVNATYSQARFLKPFWDQVDLKQTIMLRGSTYSGEDIKAALESEMDDVFNTFVVDEKHPIVGPFINPLGIADGNQYGVLLNHTGVAVNQLPITKGLRNNNITLDNISIDDIKGNYTEVRGIIHSEVVDRDYGALAKVDAAAIGAVFRYDDAKDLSGYYVGNVVLDAMLFLSSQGFGSISEVTLEWAKGGTQHPLPFGLQGNIDSMAHFTKGSAGCILLGASDITINGLTINNIVNVGAASDTKDFMGNKVTGLLLAACDTVDLTTDIKISHLHSDTGDVCGIYYHYSNIPLPLAAIGGLSGQQIHRTKMIPSTI